MLGGSAVSGTTSKRAARQHPDLRGPMPGELHHAGNVGAGNKTSAKWFSGISCSQKMFMFGEAFLAESATKFDGSGGYFTALRSAI